MGVRWIAFGVVPGQKLNRDKHPSDWIADIGQSVKEYDAWYPAAARKILEQTRSEAAALTLEVMTKTNQFRTITAEVLRELPQSSYILRQALLPPLARDRLVTMSGANKSLVQNMERNGKLGKETDGLGAQLTNLADYFTKNLDPSLFSWVSAGGSPVQADIDRVLIILGDRHALACFNTLFRNEQERRQKELLRGHLTDRDFKELTSKDGDVMKMPPGSFSMGRNLEGKQDDGTVRRLPTDCVVAPLDSSLPTIALEMKSAGDWANVNKRRKEEADKHHVLKNRHGSKITMVLQLFGYFNETYLVTERSAGIDWAWDHRLEDLDPHLGI